jgi:hypothetical protein
MKKTLPPGGQARAGRPGWPGGGSLSKADEHFEVLFHQGVFYSAFQISQAKVDYYLKPAAGAGFRAERPRHATLSESGRSFRHAARCPGHDAAPCPEHGEHPVQLVTLLLETPFNGSPVRLAPSGTGVYLSLFALRCPPRAAFLKPVPVRSRCPGHRVCSARQRDRDIGEGEPQA